VAETAFLDQLFFRRDGETASLWKAQYIESIVATK
jgi:hypothetical protein